MARVASSDVISLTADYAGYTQHVVKEVLEAYTQVVLTLLKNGCGSRLLSLGRFDLRPMSAKEERDFKLPQTGEVVKLSASPAYQKPFFAFTPSKFDEIRKATEGDML